MAQKLIKLFMWGYQPHYRVSIQLLARNVLQSLGTAVDAKALLVGVRRPANENPHAVCVEPEYGEWPLSLFDDLPSAIEALIADHPLQNMFYSDEPSMRDKPERIRSGSVSTGVRDALRPFDEQHNVKSFCGDAVIVDDFYVVPVIQIPKSLLQKFPSLRSSPERESRHRQGHLCLIDAAMSAILEEASEELRRKEPGRFVSHRMRAADEVARIAAKNFMHTPGLAIERLYIHADLFDRFNLISSLMYEGAEGIGHILLVDPASTDIDYLVKFLSPVPFREARWARKVLQMAASDLCLVADSVRIYGLGRLRQDANLSSEEVFTIDFLDHYHWEIRCGDNVLLRSRYGEPKLPQEIIEQEDFIENFARLFPKSLPERRLLVWELFRAAKRQDHGCMIMVAEDAASEAGRLSQQGTSIEPVVLTPELLARVSGIDGTIILDPNGLCYAVGVILDGLADNECTPSRGSRFNSAIRYIKSADANRLAIVVSDDKTVDVFPLLRPIVSRSLLETKISSLEAADLEDYHEPRSWLDSHRFYMSDSQCERINAAMARIEAMPREVGEIYIVTRPFEVDPEMDQSYLAE